MCGPCKTILDCQGAAKGSAYALSRTLRLFGGGAFVTAAISADALAEAYEYVATGLVTGILNGAFNDAEVHEILIYTTEVCDTAQVLDMKRDALSFLYESGKTAAEVLPEIDSLRATLNAQRDDILQFGRDIAMRAQARVDSENKPKKV